MGKRLKGWLIRLLAVAAAGALLWYLLPPLLAPISGTLAQAAAVCTGLSFLSPAAQQMVEQINDTENQEAAQPVEPAASQPEETESPSQDAVRPAQDTAQALAAIADPADPTAQPAENTAAVVQQTYREGSSSQYLALDSGWVRNLSGLGTEEILSLSRQELPFDIELNSDQPQVLIYHTHATESYLPTLRGWYGLNESFRSDQNEENMVAVGEVLTQTLEQAGIKVIHDTTQHDNPSYTGAYDRSRETMRKYLEQYPSIKVTLDVHRDAITRDDNTVIAPTATVEGQQVAQVMIISCADGDRIPNFRQNFTFAAGLQQQAAQLYPDLMRPILFDQNRFYNQDLTTGSLLLEFGSHGNTLAQAKRSAVLVGNSLVALWTGEG
ncbi:MAG TPA: stage II sporulation protein P [Candidatus Egerieicola pullicola]|uniref:Stage II sporulation protein P n=1 Tax=Candidatus Egerieicola pullicola TaxID=2840775 RepID=A0A9D1AIM0_9FIRM|nr:stage II sporulation protein P [Candidatus Egerieicola pullicola]